MFALLLLLVLQATPEPTPSRGAKDQQYPERTPHRLLQRNEPEAALELMKQDPKRIQERDRDRFQPLHYASRGGHLSVVEWLLAHGADVNAQGMNDTTPIDMANDPAIIAALLKAKPNLELERWNGSPLQRAAAHVLNSEDAQEKEKAGKIFDLLRAAGANYDLTSAIYLDDVARVRDLLESNPKLAFAELPRAPLRTAAQHGRLEICKELLKIPGIDVNDLGRGCGFPIILDALPHAAIVRLLTEHKADIHSRITWRCGIAGIAIVHHNAPLLHYAARGGSPETIQLLIEKGADPFVEIFDTFSDSKEPQTAFDVAAAFGNVDNLLALIRHAKFRDAPKEKRQPLLDRCLVCGTIAFQDEPVDHTKLYQGLLEAGADPNAVYDGRTAIQEAAGNLRQEDGQDEVSDRDAKKHNDSHRRGVAILRKAGAKIDLFSAAAFGDEQAVREILKSTPKEASALSPDGFPALHVAARMNHANIISMLLHAGCDVNIRNQSQETGVENGTALDEIATDNRPEIEEILIQAGGKPSSEIP